MVAVRRSFVAVRRSLLAGRSVRLSVRWSLEGRWARDEGRSTGDEGRAACRARFPSPRLNHAVNRTKKNMKKVIVPKSDFNVGIEGWK